MNELYNTSEAVAALPPKVSYGAETKPRRAAWHKDKWEAVWRYRHFYLFVAPYFLLFAVFGLYPVLFSLFLSFVQWDGLTSMHWIGLGNFVHMGSDSELWQSLWNTVVIGVMYVPAMLLLAFFFAQLLNTQWLKAKAFWRAAFFLPCVTPMVVIAIVFTSFFSSEHGILNYGLGFLKIPAIPWLSSEQWSKVSIAILVLWRWTGYNMVLMLAGLQGIPVDYYEAAALDGASRSQQMLHITWPMMKPTFRFCLLMSVIGCLYMFDEVFVLTAGGPGTSSETFGLYLFNTSFTAFKFGYASCVAYSAAIVVFAASLFVTQLNASRMRRALA